MFIFDFLHKWIWKFLFWLDGTEHYKEIDILNTETDPRRVKQRKPLANEVKTKDKTKTT